MLILDQYNKKFYKRSREIRIRNITGKVSQLVEFKVVSICRVMSVIKGVISLRTYTIEGPDKEQVTVCKGIELFDNIKSKNPNYGDKIKLLCLFDKFPYYFF